MRFIVLGLSLILAGAAEAGEWRVVGDASRLGFIGMQDGERFEGRFREFDAAMRFDARDLANSHFDVTVDTGSADTGSRQRDSTLDDAAWFHTQAYPQARFVTETIRRADGEYAYEAVAELTIRGNTRRVVLPFDWTTHNATAQMQGRVTLDRTAFGVGQGEWSQCATVGCEVDVVVDLELKRLTKR
jgi:polyisoprenoid-binding protein YceI